jgi:hypothetical protein
MKLVTTVFLFMVFCGSAFALSISKNPVLLNNRERVVLKNASSGAVTLDSIRIVSDSPMVPLEFSAAVRIATFSETPGPCYCAVKFTPGAANNKVSIGGELYPSTSGMTRGKISIAGGDSIEVHFANQDYNLGTAYATPREGNVYSMIFYHQALRDTLRMVTHNYVPASVVKRSSSPVLAGRPSGVDLLGRKPSKGRSFRLIPGS